MKELKEARMGMIAVTAVVLASVARRLIGTRRLSSGMMVLAVAGAVLLVAAGGASANGACIGATTVFGPGDTVTESCTFNASMTCPAGHGLIIGADGITIDGAGYAVIGDRTACPNCGEANPQAGYTGILNYNASLGRGHDDVVIKDLEIKNFCNGIVIKGAGQDDFYPAVDNNTIFECSVHDNGDDAVGKVTHGIHLWRATNATVKDCAVYNNTGYYTGSCGTGGHGIRLFGNSDNCTVEECDIYNNTRSGIFTKYKCVNCTIACNKITDNGAATDFCGGIRLMCMMSNYNIIRDNNVSENLHTGIYIGGKNNIIRYNTVLNNEYCGIDMGRSDGSYNNELYENTVCGNSECDIRTCGPECYENHGYNNTCNTTSYYNDDGTAGCTYDCEHYEVGCVAEDGTVFGCGDTVTKNCTFNGDMKCQVRYGLIIGADNITIDGAGYALERADSGECTLCPSAGVLNKGYGDVTITNLEIKHFCNGIYLDIDYESGDVVCRNTIENCNIHHNGNATSPSATHGIKMRYMFNSTIRNNSVHDQIAYVDPNPGCEDGGNGLFLYTGDHNNIIGNKFYNNQKAGMLIKMKPTHWNISHNHLWGNGQGGIILRCKLCDFNLIEHNNASDNYGSGIFIGGNDNTIRYNTVCNNRDGGPYYDDSVGGHGYGINIGRGDGSLDNTLISNTVCGNDHLDIRVVTGVTGNTGDENTCNTTLNYDDTGTTGCTYSCSMQQPLGDLNGDGAITPADAVIALQMAVRGEYSKDADVSGDHMVTSLDALLILQAAARM